MAETGGRRAGGHETPSPKRAATEGGPYDPVPAMWGRGSVPAPIAPRDATEGRPCDTLPADVRAGHPPRPHRPAGRHGGPPLRHGKLRELTAAYVQLHVLFIDEVGYLQHANSAVNFLYGVIDQRALRCRPVILTSNRSLRQWGEVPHDSQIAKALLDRILKQGKHIGLSGKS